MTKGRTAATLAAIGPGIVVMLADTDAGSLVTAAQSGARWGYSLLALQLLLIPVLYIVQELTARLGTSTGKGHGELILDRYGPVWAWISFGGRSWRAWGRSRPSSPVSPGSVTCSACRADSAWRCPPCC